MPNKACSDSKGKKKHYQIWDMQRKFIECVCCAIFGPGLYDRS